MAAFLTVEQVLEALRDSLPASTDHIDAINQVGDKVYSAGRWPDTKVEIEIATAEIRKEATADTTHEGSWFVYIDAELYDGAIGFRVNANPGFDIKPQEILYRGKGNPGACDFIDMGISDESAGDRRKYRCPVGVNDNDNIAALVKRKWQMVYDNASIVRIRPLAAIKNGIIAVSYENENEPQKARVHWDEMEKDLLRDHKQFAGPRQVIIHKKNHYRRRPISIR